MRAVTCGERGAAKGGKGEDLPSAVKQVSDISIWKNRSDSRALIYFGILDPHLEIPSSALARADRASRPAPLALPEERSCWSRLMEPALPQGRPAQGTAAPCGGEGVGPSTRARADAHPEISHAMSSEARASGGAPVSLGSGMPPLVRFSLESKPPESFDLRMNGRGLSAWLQALWSGCVAYAAVGAPRVKNTASAPSCIPFLSPE